VRPITTPRPDAGSGRPTRLRPGVVACVLYFLLAGLVFLPRVGIYNDEALFARGVYLPEGVEASLEIAGVKFPVMLMPYVGALKSLLYKPWLAWAGPSLWSLRLPVLLFGAATIVLMARTLELIAGPRAGILAAVLLATDVPFLFATLFDWGPVALQNLLWVAAGFFLARFTAEKQARDLAVAGFLLGLGLWDKALFIWNLVGLAVAFALVYRRYLPVICSWSWLSKLVGGFLAGSAPLLAYCLKTGFQTFLTPEHSLVGISQKLTVLAATLQGTVMYGFIVRHGEPATVAQSQNPFETVAVAVDRWLGTGARSGLPWAVAIAVLYACLAARPPARRFLGFLVTGMGVTWFQMAITKNAGGSAHHLILLWPWLIAWVALALSQGRRLPERWFAIGIVAAVAASNLLVATGHLARLVQFGPARGWTDGVLRLAEAVKVEQPRVVYVTDWGVDNALIFLLQGRIPVANAVEPYSLVELSQAEREQVLRRLSDPNAIFVFPAPGYEFFPHLARLLDQEAAAQGYEKRWICAVADSQGRTTYLVARYQPRSRL